MKHTFAGLLMAALLCTVTACTPHTDAGALAAHVESGFFVTGTLAALGSFEWDAAPLMNRDTVVRHTTAVALKNGRLTRERAQEILNTTDDVRHLLDQAMAACAQDSRTAKCTKDEAGGRLLLDKARAELSTLP